MRVLMISGVITASNWRKLRVLQCGYSVVTVLLQWCYSVVTVLSQCCYSVDDFRGHHSSKLEESAKGGRCFSISTV
jgi:hypothetical protein